MEEKQISDMYLAAALIAYKARLIRIDKADRRHQKFIFEEGTVNEIWVENGLQPLRVVTPPIKEIETYFASKRLYFPPSYPDTIRSIKSAIHST